MSQSLYTSMGGIAAAQTMLEVVSDNIANINTTAFKEAQVTFENLFSQTLTSGTSASAVTGGTNPVQIGLGVQVSSISKNFTSGTWTATGQDNDLMIEGNGFFTVRDSEGNTFLTKAGDFSIDDEGNLVTSGGYYIVGTDYEYSTTCSPENVKIPESITASLNPNATFAAQNMDDLNNLVEGKITDGTITFDLTIGAAAPVSVSINTSTMVPAPSSIAEIVTAINARLTALAIAPADCTVSTVANTGCVTFNCGATSSIDFNSSSTSNFFLTTGLSAAEQDVTTHDYVSNILDYTVSIDPATSLTDTSKLKSHAIGDDGSIACTYNNGDVLTVSLNDATGRYEFQYTTSDNVVILGSKVNCNPNVATPANLVIQIADVTNEDGLISIGSNMYETGQNSGAIVYSVGGSMGMGSIASGGLESSNVDLSKQFSNMIVAQRAIQANSRVFSTSSDILETLVNLGR